MTRIPVGLQLYSVREACKEDFYGTLKQVAEMGYDGVEFAGFYDKDAGELKKVIDDLGLRPAGSHTGLHLLTDEEARKRTLDYNRRIGNSMVVVPGLPESVRQSADALRDMARRFADLSGLLTEQGFATGYHNHWWEFAPVDGLTPWDEIFQNTPKEFIMQLDIGHALRAGADPVNVLHKYAGRARAVHVKDYSRENGYVIVGEGDVQWAEVFGTCESEGRTEWYIIEQEVYPFGPLETVKRCLEAMREMGR